ncbi:hypothetical protein BKA69DRAFT_614252 [Paraphysoderma sedebokerense]|nr:hypothetical protein BKA69DRAFT_614252 [Paraphysoderma sedebokerense]
MIVIRELTGGIYFGQRSEVNADGVAHDTMTYSVSEVTRITHLAAALSLKHSPPLPITLVDKANVLATSRVWRSVTSSIMKEQYPNIPFSICLVDSAAMHMIKNPKSLNGIVLTGNLFGDILSDEASVIPGSLGLMPSASLGAIPTNDKPVLGVYEPIHGSAPDIAGQNIANPIGTILSVAMMFRYSLNLPFEADAIEAAVKNVLSSGLRTKDLGGHSTTTQTGDAIIQALRATLTASSPSTALMPSGRRPMTLCEKIIYNNAVSLKTPSIKPGDMVCVTVDWTLASELTWKGMEKTYNLMGRPKIHRNDRFWLAIDHTVDPSIYHLPKPRELIKASEDFAKEVGLKDFYGPNQTILHTEFYRERAQPGHIVIGADSHSCSAGGVGAADVVMPLVTGETWFKVPETCEIRFINAPKFGIGGKDVILYVLGELKRNTVAFERAVEYTGPGVRHLSCDARFAIANMTTEFGGIAGVFEADEITAGYINRRKDAIHKNSAKYFRADQGAQYAETHVIDLSKVDSLIALYPSPDNVVPVDNVAGKHLDGVFIGACTTAEEDLILGALVLEAGMKSGLVPAIGGKRKVTPGSVSIVAKLRKLGLLDIYEKAGFVVGAPGCSYCLGIAADVAGEGEFWLSSQNRNFKNRMGKGKYKCCVLNANWPQSLTFLLFVSSYQSGSIGNLASAATVAASSFDMKITNPRSLLDKIDAARFQTLCNYLDDSSSGLPKELPIKVEDVEVKSVFQSNDEKAILKKFSPPGKFTEIISGRAQVFGDHVDTDQIIPAQFMPGTSDLDLGSHCFEFNRPEFRQKAKEGANIVIAGVGFGSGSSREEAPRALNGCGVKAVIAKSFGMGFLAFFVLDLCVMENILVSDSNLPYLAFIYNRNQYNMALLGLVVSNPRFYELAKEDSKIQIDMTNRFISLPDIAPTERFEFSLSRFEERLVKGNGVTELYKQYGKWLFRVNMMDEQDGQSTQSSGPSGSGVQVEKSDIEGGLIGIAKAGGNYFEKKPCSDKSASSSSSSEQTKKEIKKVSIDANGNETSNGKGCGDGEGLNW